MADHEENKEPPEIAVGTIRVKPDLSELRQLLVDMLAVIDKHTDD